MGIGLLEGFPAIWNVATATVPSAIVLLLNPAMRQLFPKQETDFPAFVADVPATTVTPVISEEKLNDHWRAAVWAPPVDVKLIGRATVPPGVPDPDPMDSVTLCPKAIVCKPSRARVMSSLRNRFAYRRGRISGRIGLHTSSRTRESLLTSF
jgi:hypothetical protein